MQAEESTPLQRACSMEDQELHLSRTTGFEDFRHLDLDRIMPASCNCKAFRCYSRRLLDLFLYALLCYCCIQKCIFIRWNAVAIYRAWPFHVFCIFTVLNIPWLSLTQASSASSSLPASMVNPWIWCLKDYSLGGVFDIIYNILFSLSHIFLLSNKPCLIFFMDRFQFAAHTFVSKKMSQFGLQNK